MSIIGSVCRQCGLPTTVGDHATGDDCLEALFAEEDRRRAAFNADDWERQEEAASEDGVAD
jgi:hypothetical protein